MARVLEPVFCPREPVPAHGQQNRQASARISVVIPCLDEAATASERLSDLQCLREAGHELILVDGGSRDGTPEIARPLVDSLHCSPRGRAVQMNLGAELARCEVLWFLHLDTRPPPGAAGEVLKEALDGAGWGCFDVRLEGGAPMFRVIASMMNLRSRLTGMVTGDQGLFVRRDLFQKVGGFPEIALMEDLALSRCLKQIVRPARPPGRMLVSGRRWERDGIWRTILLMWLLRGAYSLGADTARLARVYYPEKTSSGGSAETAPRQRADCSTARSRPNL